MILLLDEGRQQPQHADAAAYRAEAFLEIKETVINHPDVTKEQIYFVNNCGEKVAQGGATGWLADETAVCQGQQRLIITRFYK